MIKKFFKKCKAFALSAVGVCLLLGAYGACVNAVPDSISTYHGAEVFSYPITTMSSGDVSEDSDGNKSYQAQASILGVIPLKSVTVTSTERPTVIPGGEAFGLKFYTEGVIVVGVESFESQDGKSVSPAGDKDIRPNDIITAINGQEVNSNDDLLSIIGKSEGKPQKLTVKRGHDTFKVSITPVKNSDGLYKIGVWVRDSTAGIGTVTFYLENGVFGSLGHGICDVDTGELLPLRSASCWGVEIFDVNKSLRGQPGELRGVFNDDASIGNLVKNTVVGGFGVVNEGYQLKEDRIEVALSSEVKEGAVTIISTVDGKGPCEYSAEIVRINRSADGNSKNMLIKITDQKLLEKTGGIVQGMSGSPIIQNGRLVGAVTHVLVNQPEMGYGIFIENMLAQISDIA